MSNLTLAITNIGDLLIKNRISKTNNEQSITNISVPQMTRPKTRVRPARGGFSFRDIR